MHKYILLCAALVLIVSCTKSKEELTDETPASFQGLVIPSHFPPAHYQFQNNPITEAGFHLGRKLFYEKKLSSDNTISCGSCHAQVHAFADHGLTLSEGVNGALGTRNSPALSNLAWYPAFMWDGGVNHIEVMPFAPISNPVEMNEDMSNVVTKLQQSSEYPSLFEKAFGTAQIDDQKLLFALAQFMSMMVSSDSKYDRVMQGTETFTELELEGYQLFQSNCASCHAEPLFTDFSYRNNGLSAEQEDDAGRYLITLLEEDRGKFKVPSLRNVQITYPYMHDGRTHSLAQVIEHYSSGIEPSNTLDPGLSNMNFSAEEKQALLFFLYTLNDYTYMGNHQLSEP